MNEYYDVIIVGTGAAGLYCALMLPERKKILMLTKQEADLSDSFLAQGGICMLRGEDDYKDYFEDTMRAGHYENNERAVDLMIRSSNDIIRDLVFRKVDFARTADGELDFTREGAHSRPRILFHKDITGKEITSTLLKQVLTKENIEIREHMTMVDLIEKDNICGGVVAMDEENHVYPTQMLTVVLTATLASIGTAGVPGAGMVMLAMVLTSVGLPVDGIALVAGVDRIFDMGRTVVNITGDASCCIVVSNLEKKHEARKSARNA